MKNLIKSVLLTLTLIVTSASASWTDTVSDFYEENSAAIVAGTSAAAAGIATNAAVIAATTKTALVAVNTAGQVALLAPTLANATAAVMGAEAFGGMVGVATVATVPAWVPVAAGVAAATAVGVCVYDVMNEDKEGEEGVCEKLANRIRD